MDEGATTVTVVICMREKTKTSTLYMFEFFVLSELCNVFDYEVKVRTRQTEKVNTTSRAERQVSNIIGYISSISLVFNGGLSLHRISQAVRFRPVYFGFETGSLLFYTFSWFFSLFFNLIF